MEEEEEACRHVEESVWRLGRSLMGGRLRAEEMRREERRRRRALELNDVGSRSHVRGGRVVDKQNLIHHIHNQ